MNHPNYRLEDLGFANCAASYGNSFGLVGPTQDGRGKSFYISYYRSEGKAELLAYDCDRKTAELRRYRSNSRGLYGLLQASDAVKTMQLADMIYENAINR